MQSSPKNAVGPLPFANDTIMVVSDDETSGQMDDDCEEDDTTNWNDEMDNDCEENYIDGHNDCSKEDKDDNNDIPNCNYADGSIKHATTIELEDVQCYDHATTIVLEDVQCDDPIYDNSIVGDNRIRSLDDSDQIMQCLIHLLCVPYGFHTSLCDAKMSFQYLLFIFTFYRVDVNIDVALTGQLRWDQVVDMANIDDVVGKIDGHTDVALMPRDILGRDYLSTLTIV
ncbi:Uncharacterized protein TCM_044719 [Theobroma cacao]|uniref:Uncharacterized protein n=1 Tax=Theobroma cacao TaxID=3641 RepID=A0A061FR77_THECC|nr:Uncharacterized protein TCM_044719 [Theobroma cacao]